MARQAKTVDEVVRALLGKRAESMSAKERDAIVRAFVDAGKGAVQARTGSLRDAAEAVRRAKELLADARMAMARAADPEEAPAPVTDDAWSLERRALSEARDDLSALPEVIGTSVGHRRRAGVETDERVVVVYVRRKLAPAELEKQRLEAVPRRLSSGRSEVATDVVELGEFEPLLDAGCSVGPQGSTRRGTLGVFAEENGTGRMVALTAMHVTGRKSFPPGKAMTLCAPTGEEVLGELLRGVRDGLDAAAVLVSPPAAGSRHITKIGQVRGRRPVSDSGDRGAAVRMFGAKSGLVSGRIEDPSIDLELLIPKAGSLVEFTKQKIRSAILVDIPSRKGDSGAALVDNSGLVLGLLAGRFKGSEGKAVFSPIMSVLHALKCDIPTT
jgi:hypothetical protein